MKQYCLLGHFHQVDIFIIPRKAMASGPGADEEKKTTRDL